MRDLRAYRLYDQLFELAGLFRRVLAGKGQPSQGHSERGIDRTSFWLQRKARFCFWPRENHSTAGFRTEKFLVANQHRIRTLPSVEAVARAVAGRDASRLQPSGAYAANLLGLSDQVPMKVVFLTDGPSRKVHIGKQELILKRTTPSRLLKKSFSTRFAYSRVLKTLGFSRFLMVFDDPFSSFSAAC